MNKNRILILAIGLLASSQIIFTAKAQFVEVGAGFADVMRGSMEWGDYDNDGDLDLLSAGCSVLSGSDNCAEVYNTSLYQNNGGSFSEVSTTLPDLDSGSVAWGDYDNDGDLDVLIVGRSASFIGAIYKNNGGGAFQNINGGLKTVRFGMGIWGDYDNDGDLDVFIAGRDGDTGTAVSQLYRNEGADTFVPISTSIANYDITNASWTDYDSDGDLDLFISGTVNSQRSTRIYRNDGNGQFSEVGSGIIDVDWGSFAWGDYDNDGDPDLLLTGFTNARGEARVYTNTSGTFSDAGAGLTGAGHGQGAWGDYDNDGFLDILIAGLSDGGQELRVYRNLGNGAFSQVASFAGMDHAAVGWADFDQDGDLDFSVSGIAGNAPETRLYRNTGASTANTRPGVPQNLVADTNTPGQITFSWDDGSDAETPAAGLTYAIRLGTTDGGIEIISPAALASGIRKNTQRGNVGQNSTIVISGLAAGDYFWSVQSVDQGYAGSVFTDQQMVTLASSGGGNAPTVSPIPPVNVLEDAVPVDIILSNYFDDVEDGGDLTYAIESNSNDGLLATAILSDVLTLTFSEDLSGAATLQIKGSDQGNQSVSTTLTVQVSSVNDAPSFDAGEEVLVLEDEDFFTVSNWASNISAGPFEMGQVLTFEVETLDADLFEVLPSVDQVGNLTFKPAPDAFGTAQIQLTLQDNGGTVNGGVNQSAPTTFDITVIPVNDMPQFQRGDNISIEQNAGPQSFRGWATGISAGPPNESDQQLEFLVLPDREELFEVLPTITIEDDEGTLNFTPVEGDTGTVSVTVLLNDNGGTSGGGRPLSLDQVFTIGIGVANSAPTVQEVAQFMSPAHNEPLTIQATVRDLEDNLSTVLLNWRVDLDINENIEMAEVGPDVYEADIPGLAGGTSVLFAIVAEDSLGLVDSTAVPSSYTVRPDVPEFLPATVFSERIDLSWTQPTGGFNFNVYRSSPDGFDLIAEEIREQSYSDTNLGESTTHTYRVTAVNLGGESGFSEDLVVTRCELLAPALSGRAGPGRNVLQWDASSGCLVNRLVLRRNEVLIDSLNADVTSFVDESVMAGTTYSYDIQAVDAIGQTSLTGPAIQLTPFVYPENYTIASTPVAFPDYSARNSYRMVGVPGLTNISFFDTFEGTQGEDWNAFFDTGRESDNQDEFLSSFDRANPAIFSFKPGRGFWVIQKQPWQVSGNASSVPLNLVNTFPVELHEGWNIISNPFDRAVSRSAVETLNPGIQPFYAFNGSYSESTALTPFEGYYFMNESGRDTLWIPYPDGREVVQAGKSITTNPVEEAAVSVVATLGTDGRDEARILFSEEASNTLDQWDKFGPPGMFSKVWLRLFNSQLETSFSRLSQEARTSSDENHVFDLKVFSDENNGYIQLEVTGLTAYDHRRVHLVDLATASFYDLHEKPFVWVPASSNIQSFQLLIGDQEFIDEEKQAIQPTVFELSQNYPNPFSSTTTIGYSIPEHVVGEPVMLSVFNMLGQRVATLVDRIHLPGRYEVTWHADSMPSGIYMYRLKAGQHTVTRTMVRLK